jgi:hypothetical protein
VIGEGGWFGGGEGWWELFVLVLRRDSEGATTSIELFHRAA